jgi:hypothetical protein
MVLPVAGGLELDGDGREWVPQSETVSLKPLLPNVSQGSYINPLRARASGVLSRHRHHGPRARVHAAWNVALSGARLGGLDGRLRGETHTLVPDDDTGMTTLFYVTGGYTMTTRATINVDGIPISYLTAGVGGRLVLLLHGTYWSRTSLPPACIQSPSIFLA